MNELHRRPSRRRDGEERPLRLAPVEEPTPEAKQLLDSMYSPTGEVLGVFGTLAHNPRLLKRFNLLGSAFIGHGRISGRQRELMILRVGALAGAEYEFGQHVLFARREGVTDVEIARLLADDIAEWEAPERHLLQAAEEICADDEISDATFAALRETFDDGQLLEILLLVGFYRMVSGFLNSAGVMIDAGVPGWGDVGGDVDEVSATR
jgi:alkylhydroperoxidase family enzyme